MQNFQSYYLKSRNTLPSESNTNIAHNASAITTNRQSSNLAPSSKHALNATLQNGLGISYTHTAENERILQTQEKVSSNSPKNRRNSGGLTGEFFNTYSYVPRQRETVRTTYTASKADAAASYTGYLTAYSTSPSNNSSANLRLKTLTSGPTLNHRTSYSPLTVPKTNDSASKKDGKPLNELGLSAILSSKGDQAQQKSATVQTQTVSSSRSGGQSYSAPKTTGQTNNSSQKSRPGQESKDGAVTVKPTVIRANLSQLSTAVSSSAALINREATPKSSAADHNSKSALMRGTKRVTESLQNVDLNNTTVNRHSDQTHNTTLNGNDISQIADRSYAPYQPKYKPQPTPEKERTTYKPLYQASNNNISYGRYVNISLKTDHLLPNKSKSSYTSPKEKLTIIEADVPLPSSRRIEDQMSFIARDEEEQNTSINPVPTSPISIKRANSPNIRGSIDSAESKLNKPPLFPRNQTTFDEEGSILKPPSRIASPSSERYSRHKTPDTKLMPSEKSSTMSSTHKESELPKTSFASSDNLSFKTPQKEGFNKTPSKHEATPDRGQLVISAQSSADVAKGQRTNRSRKASNSHLQSSATPLKISVDLSSRHLDATKARLSKRESTVNTTPNPKENRPGAEDRHSAVKTTAPKPGNPNRMSYEGASNPRAISLTLMTETPVKIQIKKDQLRIGKIVKTEEDWHHSNRASYPKTTSIERYTATATSKSPERGEDSASSRTFGLNFLKNIFTRSPEVAKDSRCLCDGSAKKGGSCKKALGWLLRRYNESEFEYLRNTYETILGHDLEDEECVRQIQKDLHRTFPRNQYFSEEGGGLIALERVLNAFAKYDPQIGYVQGMNFIVGSLLYHAEEYIAFWLLVMIVENFEMRDVFMPKLPGLSKHCQIVDILLANYLPEIYRKLCKMDIRVEMYCSEWVFSLFASVVPVELMGQFYDKLFEQEWPFFYKVILAILDNFKGEIMAYNEFSDILMLLKSQNHVTKGTGKALDWNKLFNAAVKIEVDSKFIYTMHSNFDIEKLNFRVIP